MKAFIVTIVCFCVLSQLVLAKRSELNVIKGHSLIPDKSMNSYVHPVVTQSKSTDVISHLGKLGRAGGFCDTCIQFADNALDFLLNAVLNLGIVGSCQALCSYVEQKTGSQIVGTVCDILCDIAGIDEFVKIIEKADLDPIYYCELLKACPVNDHGDANITMLTVMPNKGPQGNFEIQMKYVSKNGTGTGEIFIGIKTVDGVPLEDAFLNIAQPPGTYVERINLKAQPDPDCDPSQGPCESWKPGVYYVEMAVCNGECGSKHPHSQVYSQAKANFTIV
jgi:hypothetical protein